MPRIITERHCHGRSQTDAREAAGRVSERREETGRPGRQGQGGAASRRQADRRGVPATPEAPRLRGRQAPEQVTPTGGAVGPRVLPGTPTESECLPLSAVRESRRFRAASFRAPNGTARTRCTARPELRAAPRCPRSLKEACPVGRSPAVVRRRTRGASPRRATLSASIPLAGIEEQKKVDR